MGEAGWKTKPILTFMSPSISKQALQFPRRMRLTNGSA